MKTIYLSSVLLWWLLFLFGKSHAQQVQYFSNGQTNGDIEMSPAGEIWGIIMRDDATGSGFERIDPDGQIIDFQQANGKLFRHVGTGSEYLYFSYPEMNKIYRYNYVGACVDSIVEVDNPGNLYVDAQNNLYTVETDQRKLVKFSPNGTKTVLASGTWLNDAFALTGDPDGNLYTANRYTGKIIRWDKAGGELAPFAQIPTGTLCADGSQISEIVFSKGMLYVASVGLSVIYRVNEFGEESIVAGAPGMSQEMNGAGTKARFVKPVGLSASRSGDALFVSDNGRIRKITLTNNAGIEEEMAKTGDRPLVYPNPATDHAKIRFSDAGFQGKVTWQLLDPTGKIVQNGQTNVEQGEATVFFQESPCNTYYLVLIDPITGKRTTIPILICKSYSSF